MAGKNASTDAVQYVSGTGNDTNDGLSWGTSKAKIKTAVAALPTISSKPSGIVYIGQGVNINSGDEVTIGPWTKLVFTPSTYVTYNGTGTAISCIDAPTTYFGDGGIYDLNLNVTNNAGSGILNNECTWWKMSQVWIQGPGASSTGIPILFSNTQKWTEQSNLDLVHVQNFVNGITFQDNCASHTGCTSFSYSRWREVVVSPVGSSNYGFQLQNDAAFNGSDLEIQCFGGLTAVTCLSLTGTSNIQFSRLKVGGETSGPASTGISTTASTVFSPITLWEHWNAGTWTDSFSGTQIGYVYNVPGLAFLQATANGLAIGANGNSFSGALNTNGVTGFRNYALPDASGTLVLPNLTQTWTANQLFSAAMASSVAGGTDVGSASNPFGNLWLGTAATNNFKFQPAATAAARVISVPDPLTNVNLAFNLTATSSAFATATTAATCVQNTTAVAGAATSMVAEASPVSTPGVGAVWSAFVSSAGNVTINECAVATSAGGTIAFNIRVHP